MTQIYNSSQITIKGARVNNLKNISLSIPRNKFIVLTGLSGSGKSSLAFDTLYAEGQRRYVESLSSYARQFLGRMHKPDVDLISGLSPAIAIEQKVNSRNPRSTVGTSTEIYEYIKLLFARIGITYSPLSETVVKRHKVSDVVDFIFKMPSETNVYIASPFRKVANRTVIEHLTVLLQQGFTRLLVNNIISRIEDVLQSETIKENDLIFILIDRIKIKVKDEDLTNRLSDSVQTAFYEGKGYCHIFQESVNSLTENIFSNKFEADGITFEEPTVNMFTFNNPYGACKTCEGFGTIIGIDEDLVIPNKGLTIYEYAIACWKGEKMGAWRDQLISASSKFDFPIHKPYYALSREQQKLLWTGNAFFGGLNQFFAEIEEQSFKIQYRVMLSRYRGKTICPECEGTRLRKDAAYVKVGGKSITEIVLMPIDEALNFFRNINLAKTDREISSRLLIEIINRLKFLTDVGLGYLTLNRLSNTLSGGESQRINLATSLGSSLVGSTYILDEPSIGLHTHDTFRLIEILKRLRDIGNTVIVVEHDEDIIKAADQVIDIGPLAGSHGGELVFQGIFSEILKSEISLTGQYLSGKKKIELPARRRSWRNFIEIKGACENNLQFFDVKLPLNIMTVITGVSGSGKSSLIRGILFPAIRRLLGGSVDKTGRFGELKGDLEQVKGIELIDQNPIGRSSRSNPATYVKAFDEIRLLFADQKLAKKRNYKPGYFSFNVPGGRCDACEGEGTVKIEMQFMADVYLECDVCHGKRFKEEVLDITFEKHNIADILNLTVDDACELFEEHRRQSSLIPKIIAKLTPLKEVGLGYLRLGQSSNTLSGGEAQRIKLAYFLTKGTNEVATLFIFDEPTTGLHFHDIHKLLQSFQALIENGHSLMIIEHNPEIIKSADWVIDLGPEGGVNGGKIVFEGTPEQLILCKDSYTAAAIRDKLS